MSQAGSQASDPLGLHLVCDSSHPIGDIIFVHGLGGTARKTWSWDRNLDYFWPTWLVEEDGLSSYRIFTYGYNSDFMGAGNNLNITDFAKALLFQMLVFSDGLGKDHTSVGQQPIIFVAHSMGGLVVKRAYVLGKHDGQYTHIISKTHGIMFLATPHRGARYTKILNNILSTIPLGAPPKAYIKDLDTQSRSLQDINEQFRTVCGGLSLVSFYETLQTSLRVTKIFVVEKESGVLGYPQETSNPLNADHHTICKFKSREDENYITVKSMIKLWASRLSQLCVPSKYHHQYSLIASMLQNIGRLKTTFVSSHLYLVGCPLAFRRRGQNSLDRPHLQEMASKPVLGISSVRETFCRCQRIPGRPQTPNDPGCVASVHLRNHVAPDTPLDEGALREASVDSTCPSDCGLTH